MQLRCAGLGVATFRYQFPYMEAKRGRPDSPEVAAATVRAAVAETSQRFAGLPLIAGGKSFGARATLHRIEGGDHSFGVLKKSGRTKDEVLDELADALSSWAAAL